MDGHLLSWRLQEVFFWQFFFPQCFFTQDKGGYWLAVACLDKFRHGRPRATSWMCAWLRHQEHGVFPNGGGQRACGLLSTSGGTKLNDEERLSCVVPVLV